MKEKQAAIQTKVAWWFLPIAILVIGVVAAGGIIWHSRSRATSANSPAVIKTCDGAAASDFACYRANLDELVAKQSVADAFTYLKDKYKDNSYAQAQCHQLAHVIGKAGAKRYNEVSEAYKYGDSFCWSGYYHGVMQEVIGRLGYDGIKDKADTICAGVANAPDKRYSFDHFNCVHGLGHGFMSVRSNQLFTALETCDGLSDSWERESCYGGVFMENVMAFQSTDTKTDYLKADDPVYPCNAVQDQYKTQCYLMQTSHALQVLGGDFQKVFTVCQGVETAFRPICYQSLGRDASGRSTSNKEITKSTCLLGSDEEARSNCVIGAAKDFVSYFHSDQQAKDLCDSLDKDLATTCHDTVASYYQRF